MRPRLPFRGCHAWRIHVVPTNLFETIKRLFRDEAVVGVQSLKDRENRGAKTAAALKPGASYDRGK